MDLHCTVCGKKFILTPEDVDYHKSLKDPKFVYICSLCQAKLFYDAHEKQKPHKPM